MVRTLVLGWKLVSFSRKLSPFIYGPSFDSHEIYIHRDDSIDSKESITNTLETFFSDLLTDSNNKFKMSIHDNKKSTNPNPCLFTHNNE